MTGSIALDVVIGLVFIYLLYSLLTSLVAEIIATNLGLRARNLHAALCRMLDDEKVVAFLKSKDFSGLVDKLYEHPEIKSLSPNRFFSKPSAIPADAFVRALIDTLQRGKIEESINNIEEGIKSYHLPETVENYLLKLVGEADKEDAKPYKEIESWFDNTMRSASEWYKRNMQILLFFIGLLVAWLFNVNTIAIVDKLAVDKDARSQLVQLASDYLESENYQQIADSSFNDNDVSYSEKIDSLSNISDLLLKDIEQASTIIGGGTWLPDSLYADKNNIWNAPATIQSSLLCSPAQQGFVQFDLWDKLWFALKMLWANKVGYFITAIALSLGAPFWFDLLNRLMKLRSAVSPTKK